MANAAGKTLVELIATLAIVSVVFGFAIPSMTKMKARSDATSGINWIITAVNYTRNAAINYRTTATLCPRKLSTTNGEISCGGKWHHDLIVFADTNRDGKFNHRDFLINRISASNMKGTITWRSFRNRQFLQFTSLGYTNFQNGNFTYCTLDQNPQLARQIVVNVQGRARTLHSSNELGERTDRKGKRLRC